MRHSRLERRWRWLLWAAAAFGFCLGFLSPSRAGERDFPFDHELLLDARPMRGSKRVPNLEIGPHGQTAIELWCNRVEGQIVVVENTITVMTGQKTSRSCSPDQARADDEMLAALAEATNWRREGVSLTLIGPRTLRFRIPTN
jgi:heat shock protein HslJ